MRTTALVRGDRARAAAVVAPMDAPAVLRLTERFLELRREIFRNLVDRAVELGELLLEARPLLRGQYQRWLRERLGVDGGTAENYLRLARLARDSPGVLQRWKELGVSKLYRIARLPAPARKKVLRLDRLAAMSDREFSEATSDYLPPLRKVSDNMRAHGLRMRLRAFTGVVAATRALEITDDRLRAGLRADLAALARALRALGGRI
jgi:hypothetical protein